MIGGTLTDEWGALAAAGGAAVAQAVGTGAWGLVRDQFAAILAGGSQERVSAELAKLEETAASLVGGSVGLAKRASCETYWQARLEMFLGSLPTLEAVVAAAKVHAVVDLVEAGSGVSGAGLSRGTVFMGSGGVSVEADRNSIAAAVVHVEGGVRLGDPFVSAPGVRP